MSFSSAFASGFSVGDAIKKKKQQDLEKQQIQAALSATPETTVTQTPTYEGMTGGLDQQDIPTTSQSTTTFMGKPVDGPVDDQKLNALRNSAVIDVIKKNDPLKGFQMERQAKQDEQQNYLFEHQKKAIDNQDAYTADKQEAYKNSRIGKMQDDYANAQKTYQQQLEDYQAKKAAGNTDVGLPPSPPQQPQYSAGDRLADMSTMFGVQAKHGMLDPMQVAQYGEVLNKLQNEGYGQALKLAQSGAPIEDVAKAFNASGNIQFDPKSVTSDQVIKNKNGPSTRVITFQTPDGQSHTVNTLSELDSLDMADKTYKRFFEQKADQRADTTSARQNMLADLQMRKVGQEIGNNAEKQNAAVNYYKQQNPNATDAELNAVKAGVIDVTGTNSSKNQPAEVKLAKSLVDAGMAPDMKTALGMALTKKVDSPDSLFNSMVEAGIKNMNNPKDAVDNANQVMSSMGYTKQNGRWSQAQPAQVQKFSSEADAHNAAQEAIQKGASKDAVNQRLQSMGYAPLP